MMKGIISSLLCGSLSCLALIASASAAEVPARLQGVTGKPIQLSLDANPSTGYQWMVSSLPPGMILIPGNYQPSSSCKPGMTGCGGQQTFYLLAEQPGTATLSLIYGRPFDRSGWKTENISVEVTQSR